MSFISFTIKQICWASLAWMAITIAAIFIPPNSSPWITTPLVLLWLVMVIGALLAINIKIRTETNAEFLIYSGGLGLTFLVIGGLFMNWALPYLGVLHPLAPLPLVLFFGIVTVLLATRAYLFEKDFVLPSRAAALAASKAVPKKVVPAESSQSASWFFGIVPWAFVIMSAAGAELLNNGHAGTLTLVMLFCIALYVILLVAFRKKIDSWVYLSALYSIGVSLLFMYSLRSSHIFGWDINQEYQVFQTTLQNLRWQMSYYPSLDYNACISITIVPTILKELTNMPSEYIYKITFQLLFAAMPLAIYALAKRYLNETLAFLAAFLLIAQTWFFEQMPALIRQEVAFIFYAIAILALFDDRLSRRTKSILFYIFTIAIVLSHYSTAYVWIALMAIVLVLSYISKIFIPSLRKKPMIISPLPFVIAIAMLFIWQIPLTHISGTATTIASNVTTATSTAIATNPNQSGGVGTSVASTAPVPPSGLAGIIQNAFNLVSFASINNNIQQTILADQQQAIALYGGTTDDVITNTSTNIAYVPTVINEPLQVPQKLPIVLSDIIDALSIASKIIIIDILPLVGIVAIFMQTRKRTAHDTSRDFLLLNLAAICLLILIILIPALQQFYSLTRLYLQMFFTLSILGVIGGVMLTNSTPRYQTAIVVVLVVIAFGSLNGAFDQLTGGDARITLDQPPATLDSYYTYNTEVASAQWLGANRIANDPVQADDVAYLRLQAFANLNTGASPIFPQTIEQDSYVYLSKENMANGMVLSLYNGNLLTYTYPIDFLNKNKNLVYNDGDSSIYQ